MSRRSVDVLVWGLAGLAVVALVLAEVTRPTAVPATAAPPSTFMDPAVLETALAHRRPLRWISLASLVLRAVVAAAIAWWALRRPGRAPGRAAPLRAGLAGLAAWAAVDLVRLPLQIRVWSDSREVGLSTQDLPAWLGDRALQTAPVWAGVALGVAVAAWVRRAAPRRWVPVVGLGAGVVGAALVVVGPLVLEPLAFDFRPLPEGEVRTGIEQLVDAAGGTGDAELLVADASRRTTASNAYVSGVGGTRRIVLYDTLLADAPAEEVLAVVAHELGHDANRDLERAVAAVLGVAVLAVAAVALLVGDRPVDPDGRVTARGAAGVVALLALLGLLVQPVGLWSSRRAESAADAAAIALTDDPGGYGAMLAGLAERNLSDPAPPAWLVWLTHTHPPIAERVGRTIEER